jgi:hypothetical protein
VLAAAFGMKTPASPNCSPNPKAPGSYTCTASLSVPTGNRVFTLTAYDLTGGAGNVLSTNSTGTVFVKPTGTTTVSLVLQGVIQYAVLTLATPNPPANKPATIPLTVLLEDADQNLIVGPAPYQGGSVSLFSSDAENGQLSKNRLTSPSRSALRRDRDEANALSER